MIKKIRNELLYFIAILVVLALVLHSDLLTSPLARLELMHSKENYTHPLLWTSIVYLVLGVIRLIIEFFSYLANRNKSA